MVEVNCSVSSCYFWKLGNACGADSIWVRTQGAQATGKGRLDLGGELTAPQKTAPLTSDDTCCQTYKPRGG
jgi:hypothetical protein